MWNNICFMLNLHRAEAEMKWHPFKATIKTNFCVRWRQQWDIAVLCLGEFGLKPAKTDSGQWVTAEERLNLFDE